MTGSSDEALLRDSGAGRPAALAALYDRYGPALYRAALGLLGSRTDAEDAVQDVWVGLVRRRPGRVRNVRAYLFAALRHAALRRARTRLRGRSLNQVPEPVSPAEDPPSDRGVRLERALRSLPPEQREAIVLKVDTGMTFAELGEVLGISSNTAASRYRYALEKLRHALGARDDEAT